MNKNDIYISEIFKAIQGEGPLTGYPTIFVRTFGCTLDCEWCDSRYAIEKQDDTSKIVPIEEVVNTIISMGINDVTFTGGEPLMYKEQIINIIDLLLLRDESFKFHFETNGTIKGDGFEKYDCVDFVVSPKLQFLDLNIDSIKDTTDKYLGMLNYWAQIGTLDWNVTFKFVYETPETVNKVKKLTDICLGMNRNKIYLMPEGKEFNQAKYIECAEMCMKHGYILGSRLHTIIWGSKRGV